MRHPEKSFDIVLKLHDRRGHRLRAAVCSGLKIKVWTQSPHRYLTFHLRDIHQDSHEDILEIPEYQMAALEPGVVVYSYSFADHHEIMERTVVTDLKWRGAMPDGHPMNPVNYQTLEHLRDLIEETDRKLTDKIHRLRDTIKEEYPDKLNAEILRAQEAEKVLNEAIITLDGAIAEEIKRAEGVETGLQNSLSSLLTQFNEFQNTYNQDKEQSEQSSLESLTELHAIIASMKNAVKSRLAVLLERIEKTDETLANFKDTATRKIKGLTEDVDDLSTSLSRTDDKVAEAKRHIKGVKSDLKTEVARAQSAEDLLSTRITDTGNRLNDEAERARLVEKDLAEALQKLKQKVSDNATGSEADLTALRNELIDKIDYRIKELIGAAPEALDTLEEIAAKLKEDDDAIRVLNSILTEKVNVADVYKRPEIDSLLLDIKNLIKAETQRAQLAESKNSDAIEVIQGNEATIGSIKHALADAKHYTDDKIKEYSQDQENSNKAFQEEIRELLDEKQPTGDYVEYITSEGRKHVILPNDCNIVGTNRDGTDGCNLIMLSKYDVVDIGSVKKPVNLNGSEARPTYNDTKPIALLEDIKIEIEDISNGEWISIMGQTETD